jgi:acyl carrier protein phosphodiesterase
MNYLAHIYLSGDDEELMVGNFIADAVKGKALNQYSNGIKNGITLHRLIDAYTDSHPLHKASRTKLHERYGHYSGVMIDIFYDHYLAKNWETYSNRTLKEYTEEVYATLNTFRDVLPERISYMLKYMVPQNWLLNYGNLDGIDKVLRGMANRAKFVSGMETGVEELKKYNIEFEDEFTQFFPELRQFVNEKIAENL